MEQDSKKLIKNMSQTEAQKVIQETLKNMQWALPPSKPLRPS
jgi:hypothetical protein